jgi:hypothetical protein
LVENTDAKSRFRKMVPRFFKAIIKGILYFVFLYVIPSFILSSLSRMEPEILSTYGQLLNLFISIMLFFVVASELTSGTIIQHAFNIGKALVLMIFIVVALEGGIVTLDFQGFHLIADLRIYVVMLLTIDMLGLAKSVLQAINFLSEKTESQLPTPSLPK